ncbi:hypothetical protein AB0B52_32845 [Streptomyces griseofuscus]|uniref:hypothetical protein n=1 Tax=Streptomyces griseofuscus TaxID=146922 RepID=UPI003408C158
MYMSLHTSRRGLAATALALLLASGTAACGGDNKPAAGDQANGQHATSQDKSGPGSGSTSGDDKGVAFAACMRKNGVDVSDPQPGEQLRIPDDVAKPLLQKAEKVCGKPGDSHPAGGGEFTNDPKLEQLSLKNQQCLRANGYTAPDSKGAAAPKLPGEDPVLDRAQAACKKTGDELADYVKKVMGEK